MILQVVFPRPEEDAADSASALAGAIGGASGPGADIRVPVMETVAPLAIVQGTSQALCMLQHSKLASVLTSKQTPETQPAVTMPRLQRSDPPDVARSALRLYKRKTGTTLAGTTLAITTRVTTRALPAGEASTLHLLGRFLADPSARLHVRLNGRALGAFVCSEEDLDGPEGPDCADGGSDSNEEEEAEEPECREDTQEEGQGSALMGRPRASDVLAGRLSGLQLDSGSGSGMDSLQLDGGSGSSTDGGSHVSETPVLVFLDAAGEAGLAMLEWEAGGGSGLLGGWRPLVVAPDEGVAAELNALTQEQESAWWVGICTLGTGCAKHALCLPVMSASRDSGSGCPCNAAVP